MFVQSRERPLYEGLETDEERLAAMMAEMKDLQQTNDADGLDFAAKTSQWVAYERYLESSSTSSSSSSPPLFNDILAQYLYEPYGKRLSDCFAFGLKHAVFDHPQGAGMGSLFGMEGHVQYTAARIALVNQKLSDWILSLKRINDDDDDDDKTAQSTTFNLTSSYQVVNLGSGLDTRPFWLECLPSQENSNLNCICFWEVDLPSVLKYQKGVYQKLEAEGKLPLPKCPRQTIGMDLSKESFENRLLQPSSSFSSNISFRRTMPTCWILEGLVMYLPHDSVNQLLDEVSGLSASQSYLILNFANNNQNGPTIDQMDDRLEKHGWTKEQRLMFGDDYFNFGRYPPNKPPNPFLGFSMYRKV